MDWNLAVERNREALKRILAMLVGMAGLVTSPLAEEDASVRQGEAEASVKADGGCLSPAPTLPRHLHRAILRLLRPAESAVRRLIIVMARGLVVTLPPPRLRKAKQAPTILSKPGGTGILMPAGSMPAGRLGPRTLALQLLDPLRRSFRLRRTAPNGIPRISLPGVTAPSPIAPRLQPAPDDPLDATRLALRLQALGAALDDLPRHARRFARWKAGRYRDAAGAQNREQDAARAQNKKRRVWPLRPGRPPGQRPLRLRTHEVHEILHDLHGLAFDVLEHPDTS